MPGGVSGFGGFVFGILDIGLRSVQGDTGYYRNRSEGIANCKAVGFAQTIRTSGRNIVYSVTKICVFAHTGRCWINGCRGRAVVMFVMKHKGHVGI